MSDIQRLIIGYIPKGCSSEYIMPGDPEGSESKEEIVDLENQKFFNIKKERSDLVNLIGEETP